MAVGSWLYHTMRETSGRNDDVSVVDILLLRRFMTFLTHGFLYIGKSTLFVVSLVCFFFLEQQDQIQGAMVLLISSENRTNSRLQGALA
jgi:hypothetical protein